LKPGGPTWDKSSALQYSGNPHQYWLCERLSGGEISQKLV